MSSKPAQSGALQESTPRLTNAAPGRRVLIVDDNHDAAQSLGLLLRMTGHEVQIAHAATEGLAAAATFKPHVAILDIGMPQMNGYEAAQVIRGEPWGREILLIAVTGWDGDDDRQLALSAGFNHHMCKPVDFAALGRVIASSRVT